MHEHSALLGDRVIGDWKEDKADGRGIYTGADGTCLMVPLGPNSLVGNPPHKCHT